MINPVREQQLEEYELNQICMDIFMQSRNELYINMHYLDIALSSLRYAMDEAVSSDGNNLGLATDGNVVYFNPMFLYNLYSSSRIEVNRSVLHMLLHCIFLHFTFKNGMDRRLYDLACDIAVEHIIDSMQLRALNIKRRTEREGIYALFSSEGIKYWNAESLYSYIRKKFAKRDDGNFTKSDELNILKLEMLFARDNHLLWQPENENDKRISIETKKKWKGVREKLETALETGDLDKGSGENDLLTELSIENRERCSFKSFLRKFSILREEIRPDEDSFDYNMYCYGLEHYGNMPLIEPQETKESFGVEEFVIVIDTSYSTNGDLVLAFLESCYEVLSEKNSFFKKINIHIIQADDKIQEDKLITSEEELREYMDRFFLKGNGGTDFRPAFSYVDSLIRQKQFKHLKGLMYFTDGKGIYPAKRPVYETAFIFIEDQYDDIDVPPYAMKLVITKDELLKEINDRK
ncbi:MAG: VWA-like domain-containing protein [Eubacteriales bacterium]|nr:VWA-like domain-containing protein [Eubacteriales bacterium]